jgi:hypothetical protein
LIQKKQGWHRFTACRHGTFCAPAPAARRIAAAGQFLVKSHTFPAGHPGATGVLVSVLDLDKTALPRLTARSVPTRGNTSSSDVFSLNDVNLRPIGRRNGHCRSAI